MSPSNPIWLSGLYALILLVGCGGTNLSVAASASPGSETARILEHGPFEVGVVDRTLVDPERPTSPNGDYPGAESRTLVTRIYYPAEARTAEALRPGAPPLDQKEGPFPLIVYSHGFMSFRSESAYLAEHLASHGYIVIAPDFPLTNYFAPGDPNLADVVNQPADVSFLIDWALNPEGDAAHPLASAVDPARIGAVGLSLGGLTTTLVTFHESLRDPRIGAAVAIAPPSFMFTAPFFEPVETPFMIVAGDIDAIIPYDANIRPLIEVAPRSWIVTLHGASHTAYADIAATLFRWHDNPDSVGCTQLNKNIPADPDFLSSLKVGGQGIVLREMPAPCQAQSLPHALRPKVQHALTTAATFAFLEAAFHPAEGAPSLGETLQRLDAETASLEVLAPRLTPTSVAPTPNEAALPLPTEAQ